MNKETTAASWVDFWARIVNYKIAKYDSIIAFATIWRNGYDGHIYVTVGVELPDRSESTNARYTEDEIQVWLQQFLLEDWRFDE